jgi:hypothetical protein
MKPGGRAGFGDPLNAQEGFPSASRVAAAFFDVEPCDRCRRALTRLSDAGREQVQIIISGYTQKP